MMAESARCKGGDALFMNRTARVQYVSISIRHVSSPSLHGTCLILKKGRPNETSRRAVAPSID